MSPAHAQLNGNRVTETGEAEGAQYLLRITSGGETQINQRTGKFQYPAGKLITEKIERPDRLRQNRSTREFSDHLQRAERAALRLFKEETTQRFIERNLPSFPGVSEKFNSCVDCSGSRQRKHSFSGHTIQQVTRHEITEFYVMHCVVKHHRTHYRSVFQLIGTKITASTLIIGVANTMILESIVRLRVVCRKRK